MQVAKVEPEIRPPARSERALMVPMPRSSKMSLPRQVTALALLSVLPGCGATTTFHPVTPADVGTGSPLDPSYILVPLPSDDDSLLGRVVLDAPDNGRSLEEVTRPNECIDELTPKKDVPLRSTFEDAQELAGSRKASAVLGAFGFGDDAPRATHFYYKLDANKRTSRMDTRDYAACCKAKGTCGYGFVSALLYGEGEYATATESRAQGNVRVPVGGAAGWFVKAKLLHRRDVHGYVAALVAVTDGEKAKATSVLGDSAAAGPAPTEQSLPREAKETYSLQKIRVATGSAPRETAYAFEDGSGNITENEFVRRYFSLTDSHDLDGAYRPRRIWLYVAGGPLLAASVAVGIYGFLNLHSRCQPNDFYASASGASGPCSNVSVTPQPGYAFLASGPTGSYYYDTTETKTNQTGVALAATGVLGAVAALVLLGLGNAGADGSPSDHSLTKVDADLYVARYNRALLQKTIVQTQEQTPKPSGPNDVPSSRIIPVVSPGFSGLVGTF